MGTNIILKAKDSIDISGEGFTDGINGDRTYIDEKRGFIYRYIPSGDAQTTGTISFARYDLGFTTEEIWTPIDTYGTGSYGQLYRTNEPLYVEETGNFILPMTVADDIVGGPTSVEGFQTRWVEIEIDQDDITNSTAKVLGTYSNGVDLRVITPIFYDEPNNKIYYQRGQPNSTGSLNSGHIKYDLSNDTTDIQFYDQYLEGTIGDFIFDSSTKMLNSIMIRFNNAIPSTYDITYYEFDFTGSGTLGNTASNVVSGSFFQLNDLKLLQNGLIEYYVTTRGLFGTVSPELGENNTHRIVSDKDMNILTIRSITEDGFYGSGGKSLVLNSSRELIGTVENGTRFVRLLETQRDPEPPLISGDKILKQNFFLNTDPESFGDPNPQEFRFNRHFEERNLLVSTEEVTVELGGFEDKGAIKYCDDQLSTSVSIWDIPDIFGSIYYRTLPLDNFNEGYSINVLSATAGVFGPTAAGGRAIVRFDIDFDNIDNTTYSVIGNIADYPNILTTQTFYQILDYDEENDIMWFAQRRNTGTECGIFKLDLANNVQLDFKTVSVSNRRVTPAVRNGFVSENEIYLTSGSEIAAPGFLTDTDDLVKYDFENNVILGTVSLYNNTRALGYRNAIYDYDNGFVYKVASGQGGNSFIDYGKYKTEDMTEVEVIRNPSSAVGPYFSTGIYGAYSLVLSEDKQRLFTKSRNSGASREDPLPFYNNYVFEQTDKTKPVLSRDLYIKNIDNFDASSIYDDVLDDIWEFDPRENLIYIANTKAVAFQETVIRKYDFDLNLLGTINTGCSQSFYNKPFYKIEDSFYVHDRQTNKIKRIIIDDDDFSNSEIVDFCDYTPTVNFDSTILQILHVTPEFVYIYNSTVNGSNGNSVHKVNVATGNIDIAVSLGTLSGLRGYARSVVVENEKLYIVKGPVNGVLTEYFRIDLETLTIELDGQMTENGLVPIYKIISDDVWDLLLSSTVIRYDMTDFTEIRRFETLPPFIVTPFTTFNVGRIPTYVEFSNERIYTLLPAEFD